MSSTSSSDRGFGFGFGSAASDDAGSGVKNDDDVGAFNTLFCAEVAEPIDGTSAAGVFLNPSRVNQLVVTSRGSAADGERDFDTIPGSSGYIGDNNAVAPEKAVDVGGFASVRSAYNSDAERSLYALVFHFRKLLGN